MSVPEETLEGWRDEFGHKIEEEVLTIVVEDFGVKLVSADEVGKPQDEECIARATATDDFEKGIDFHYYHPRIGRWLDIDISVSNDPNVHAEKRKKEKKKQIIFIPLSVRDVKLAKRGAERNLERVAQGFSSAIKPYSKPQSQEAKDPSLTQPLAV